MGMGILLLLAVVIGLSVWARKSGVTLSRPEDAKVKGVCAGLATKFGMNPYAARALWIVATLLSFGFSLLLYIAMWMILPPAPQNDRIIGG